MSPRELLHLPPPADQPRAGAPGPAARPAEAADPHEPVDEDGLRAPLDQALAERLGLDRAPGGAERRLAEDDAARFGHGLQP